MVDERHIEEAKRAGWTLIDDATAEHVAELVEAVREEHPDEFQQEAEALAEDQAPEQPSALPTSEEPSPPPATEEVSQPPASEEENVWDENWEEGAKRPTLRRIPRK